MQITPELIEAITKQVVQSLSKGKDMISDRPKIFILGNQDAASCPVSYTHLDVYKRQVWGLSQRTVMMWLIRRWMRRRKKRMCV